MTGTRRRLRSVAPVIVDCAVYEEEGRRAGQVPLDQACEASNEPGTFVWIDLYEPTGDEFEALREEFSLHPLAIEDALEAHERPKLERYGDVAFLVLRTAHYDDDTEDVIFGEIMVFSGERFVITVRHEAAPGLETVRERIDAAHLRHGTAGVVHALVDLVVDGYGPVVSGLQEDIDEIEESLFSSGGSDTRRIYALGREVVEFSRAVQPLVDPARELTGGALGDADEELRSYFRDVQDHVEKVDGHVAAQRELLSNLLQANLTQVTIAQNADMRKISAWVAIVAVPTMVAGIYGMNFDHMPELRWQYGYPAVLSVIAIVCGILFTRFKRSGWL